MKLDLYRKFASAWLVCFDGDGSGAGGAGDGGAADNGAGAGAAGDGGADDSRAGDSGTAAGGAAAGDGGAKKTFTQEEVNELLAKNKRTLQAKLSAAEKAHQQLLENKHLTEDERTRLETSLEELRSASRTKEQQLIHEKKQLEERLSNQLKEAQEKVTKTWQMYENSTIERALLDAAMANEAYNPDQVATLLRRSAKLVEKKDEQGKSLGAFEVMVELADQHAETGEAITTTRTPDAAVKRMKELKQNLNLFKSGVVSGLGSHSATGGVTPGKNGRLSREQIANLSQDQYNKIRKENPALLGFIK
jgi:hypothetical protein